MKSIKRDTEQLVFDGLEPPDTVASSAGRSGSETKSMEQDARLLLSPCELKEAQAFVEIHHRHHRPPQGSRFCLKAMRSGQTVAVAIVGRPVARFQQDGITVEITRLCSDGTENACSFLIGACQRAARALGYKRIISYTLESEMGAAWRAANMLETGSTAGGAWTGTMSNGKNRANDHPLCVKRRWEKML